VKNDKKSCMNVFDTEHPLNVPRPGVELRSRRCRAYLRSVSALALVLFPFLTIFFWYLNVSDDVESTDYEVLPFWMIAAVAAINCLIISILLMSLYFLSCWVLGRFKTKI